MITIGIFTKKFQEVKKMNIQDEEKKPDEPTEPQPKPEPEKPDEGGGAPPTE